MVENLFFLLQEYVGFFTAILLRDLCVTDIQERAG